MKICKRMLAMLLCFVMVLSLVPAAVLAAAPGAEPAEKTVQVTFKTNTQSIAENVADLGMTPLPASTQVTVAEGATVEQLLKQLQQENESFSNIRIEGTMLVEIGEFGNYGTDAFTAMMANCGLDPVPEIFQYAGWMYYVDGQMPSVGIGSQKLTQDCTVEFRYGLYLASGTWQQVDFVFLDAYNGLKAHIAEADALQDPSAAVAEAKTAAQAVIDAIDAEAVGMWAVYIADKQTAMFGPGSPTDQLQQADKALTDALAGKVTPETITVAATKPALTVGVDYQIPYTVGPEGASQEVTFDTLLGGDCFTVSETGVITPVKESGMCMLQIKSKEVPAVSANFMFTILPAPPAPPAPNDYVPYAPQEIPQDWQNDLWLQYDFKELKVGDTAEIYPRRVPQAITDGINNDVERPNFNFEIVYGDSISLSTADSTEESIVTAAKPGLSIVKVTYDAFDHSAGKHFDASSQVNAAYVVYAVAAADAADTGITLKPNLTIASGEELTSYDTIYFTEGDSVELAFQPEIANADSVVVVCNGREVPAKEGVYTLPLKNCSNIVGIEMTNAKGTKYFYQVIDARKIAINVTNQTNPDQPLQTGDTAVVSFQGIANPVYKLAAIYNPTMHNPAWGAKGTCVRFTQTELKPEGLYEGYCGQWDLATKNSFTVELTRSGDLTFTNGDIFSSWWGSGLGADKLVKNGDKPNMNAPVLERTFCQLPDFTIHVEKTSAELAEEVMALIEALPAEITLDNADAVNAARAAYEALTPEAKALVTNLAVLEAAEQKLDELKNPVHFDDVTEGYWAEKYIYEAVRRGLFTGTGENTFSPDEPMTRGMFVTVLGHMAHIDASHARENQFTDVPEEAWYAPYVAWAVENGVAYGTSATTFEPNEAVTREDMAVFLYRFCKFAGVDLEKVAEPVFDDADQVSAYARKAVKAITEAGLLVGVEKNLFGPEQTACRDEAAAMLVRFARFAETTIS